VLIASGYDGAADTIVPRLLEHGADLRRVHFLEGFARADAFAGANDAGPSGKGGPPVRALQASSRRGATGSGGQGWPRPKMAGWP
jgi:hypothetical protein